MTETTATTPDPAPWPSTEGDATADAMARHFSVAAFRTRVAAREALADGHLNVYSALCGQTVGEVGFVLALTTLAHVDPDRADTVARMVWHLCDAGDSWDEIVWALCDDAGIDPESIK